MKHHYGWIIILLGALVVVATGCERKPTFYIKAGHGIMIDGDGSKFDPYRIAVDLDTYKWENTNKNHFSPYFDSCAAINKKIDAVQMQAKILLNVRDKTGNLCIDQIVKELLLISDSLIRRNDYFVKKITE